MNIIKHQIPIIENQVPITKNQVPIKGFKYIKNKEQHTLNNVDGNCFQLHIGQEIILNIFCVKIKQAKVYIIEINEKYINNIAIKYNNNEGKNLVLNGRITIFHESDMIYLSLNLDKKYEYILNNKN